MSKKNSQPFKDEARIACQLNQPLQMMFGHGQPEMYVAGGTNSSLSDTPRMCTDLLIKWLQSQLVPDNVVSTLFLWRIDTWTNSGHFNETPNRLTQIHVLYINVNGQPAEETLQKPRLISIINRKSCDLANKQ